MRESTLPTPHTGARGFQLRRTAAQAISQLEVTARNYPNGKHPEAGNLKSFFLACASACASIEVVG